MANEIKITINENYNNVLAFMTENNAPTELVEFILDRQAKAQRKPASRKPASQKPENIAMAERVEEILKENGQPMTATEIFTADSELKSTPKVVSLLKVLIAEGKVTRTEVKGKPYFELA